MSLPEVSEWARDILSRSLQAARRFNPDVVIRVAPTPGGVAAALVEAPQDGDRALPFGDGAIVVAPEVDGLLDITEPHAQLILKPAGSEPNVRAHD